MATVYTSTIGTASRDYATLSGWEAAKQGNLKTLDRVEVAACYNDSAIDDGFLLNGWETDATRYIRIYTPETERHDGTPHSGFRLAYTGGGITAAVITNWEQYVRIEGIEIDHSGYTSNDIEAIKCYNIGNTNTDVRISGCLIDGGGNSRAGGIVLEDSQMKAKVWNNIVYDVSTTRSGSIYISSAATVCAYQNTTVGGRYGIRQNTGTVYAKNNVCVSAGTADFNGTFHADSTNNCASDTTAPGSNPINSVTPANCFVDLSVSSEDFNVKDTSAPIYYAGTNLSTDAYLTVTTDALGRSRTQYDIGALEFGAAGGVGSEALAKKLYSIWKSGLVTIEADCELVDVCSEIGDRAQFEYGNPKVTLTTPLITGVRLIFGKTNRVSLRAIAGGYQYNEDNAWDE